MKSINGIPENDYNRLVELIGKEKADDYIKSQNNNYKTVVYKIYFEELKLLNKKLPLEVKILFCILSGILILWLIIL